MTAYVFYSADNGPEVRKCKEFIDQLTRQKVDCSPTEFNSRQAIVLRETYDIMDHPAVVLTRLDGSLVNKWQGDWPLVSELTYFAHI